jgi:SAM-dependent methyltransferase
MKSGHVSCTLVEVSRRIALAALQLLERLVFGGRLRERVLLLAIGAYYRSLYRRQWAWSQEPPHFFDHRMGAFDLLVGRGNPYAMARAFHAVEVVRRGDRVLDIGCGDGFFTSRFFAPRASVVDALDIEPSAIKHALRHNARPNVSYLEADAVAEPFPRQEYDVIVWDGALGHFAPDTTSVMFSKIHDALAPEGVFVGSESLGPEGIDHLQFFETLDDLRQTLEARFAHVHLRESSYELGDGTVRREGYWRCGDSPVRLDAASWRPARGSASDPLQR